MNGYKFTDEEIVKALECCLNGNVNESQVEVCSPCPFFHDGNCTDLLKQNALALINRKNAQIESLQAVHSDMTESLRLAAEANKDMQAELQAMRGAANSYKMHYENAKAELGDLREIVFMDRSEAIKNLKAEAIKEFADKLKAILNPFVCYDKCRFYTVKAKDINNLVKEMTEGQNESQNT